MVLRLLISLVPEFGLEPPGAKKAQAQLQQRHQHGVRRGDLPELMDTSPVPPEMASVIREYISRDVLQACITSFHEPYFVELQKELASLIAPILVYYIPITSTPRDVLLSLPNVDLSVLDRLGGYMAKPGSHTRQQRAIVLDMLKDLKGVSVSEMGKLPKSAGLRDAGDQKKNQRSKMAQAFMSAPEEPGQGRNRAGGMNGERGGTPDGLEGVSNLFEG